MSIGGGYHPPSNRSMVFVDGSNLRAAYKRVRSKDLADHITMSFVQSVMGWGHLQYCQIRRYWFESYEPTEEGRKRAEELRTNLHPLDAGAGVWDVELFERVHIDGKPSKEKGLDIALTTTLLEHAKNGNVDLVILVAGDADYIPLIEAVKRAGCQVWIAFFNTKESGLSEKLAREADNFIDLDRIFGV